MAEGGPPGGAASVRTVVIICINLKIRDCRRRRILKWYKELRNQSSQFKLELVFLEACDGVTESLVQLGRRYGVQPYADWALPEVQVLRNGFPASWKFPQRSGGIASTLSHLDAIRLAGTYYRDLPNAICFVAEDDIKISVSDFLDRAVGLVDKTQTHCPDWDMLLLGAGDPRPSIANAEPILGTDQIVKAGFTYLTTLYAVSRKSTEKFERLHELIVSKCIVFDELHNLLAGYTERVRPDLVDYLPVGFEKLQLVRSCDSICCQDRNDTIRDTESNALTRGRRSSSLPTDPRSATCPDQEVVIQPLHRCVISGPEYGTMIWFRRQADLDAKVLAFEATHNPLEKTRQRVVLNGVFNRVQRPYRN